MQPVLSEVAQTDNSLDLCSRAKLLHYYFSEFCWIKSEKTLSVQPTANTVSTTYTFQIGRLKLFWGMTDSIFKWMGTYLNTYYISILLFLQLLGSSQKTNNMKKANKKKNNSRGTFMTWQQKRARRLVLHFQAIVQYFEKCAYALSCQEFDDKICTTLISVR